MKINQLVALIFVLLMAVSSVGTLIMNIPKPSNEQVQIPKEKILNYKLSEQQRKYLLSQYFTLVEYSYPSVCFNCTNQMKKLEQLTQDSDNQIFLQEIPSDNVTQIVVTIASLRGQETLYDPTEQEIQDKLCELLLTRPLFCVQI